MTLREYNMGSGYGSLSRTVEEIILAFDSTYNLVKDSLRVLITELEKMKEGKPTVDTTTLRTVIVATLWNIDHAISRLNKE